MLPLGVGMIFGGRVGMGELVVVVVVVVMTRKETKITDLFQTGQS